jgi:hypothetical protein
MVAVALLIVIRSGVFVGWEGAHFDGDQAITGLMAKHLAQWRAFPVFWYGQNHMLAVESWLMAPFFLAGGVSVFTLKLPLLVINIAIGVLLVHLLVREAGLRPALAAVAALFFALPPPGTTSRLLDANGGNIEPLLYVLLIWMLRNRPHWCGLVLGLGFLNREFTIYGFVALLGVEAVRGTLFTRDGIRLRLKTLRTAAEAWLFIYFIRRFSSAAGPGTSLADVYKPQDNIAELVARTCFDPAMIGAGLRRIATEHWPLLFGATPQGLIDFGILSHVRQGLPWSWLLLLLVMLVPIGGIAWRVRRGFGRWTPAADFPVYLVLVAAGSVAGYVVGRCGEIQFFYLRYDLLSLVGAVGLAALFLQSTDPDDVASAFRRKLTVTLTRSWLVLVAVWFLLVAIPHVKLYAEYFKNPPDDVRRLLIQHLDARNVRYAYAGYWVASSITFLTNERIIVASDDFVRIREYNHIVDAHRAEAPRIAREPCSPGTRIAHRLYLCEP